MTDTRRQVIEMLAQIEGTATALRGAMLEDDLLPTHAQAERYAIAVMLWLRRHGWTPPTLPALPDAKPAPGDEPEAA